MTLPHGEATRSACRSTWPVRGGCHRGLLTIGAFAHAAGLTPKALRLYDEKGLLRPTAVDPESGYRYYSTDQIDQARLIAQLRHLGMPLAEIGSVCRLDPAAAAHVIDTYWQRVEADTTARGRLVADAPASELLTMLADAVAMADQRVRDAATDDNQPATTLTGVLRSGSQLALVHVGDTRLYLLRGGELHQLTQDHTYVQTLVDQGKLDRNEAATHRQRALLTRALGASAQPVEADLALRTALPGDRYLLCSDGLSAVVAQTALATTLSADTDPDGTVHELVNLADNHGAPDNIACVVADVVAA